ncbi:hypothetical protein ABZ891_20045 [Streptomyces sp. NPDC047023]|uniref:hypothetical protein n=1 Tax=Streptomyces sp. NPDC047023 TaxID=3155139 RepID=UPI003404BC1C
MALLTVVFLVTNTAVAAAADGSGAGGGLLGPLNVPTREGVPLSAYQLESSPSRGGSWDPTDVVRTVVGASLPFDVAGELQRLVLNGLFTLVRLLAGLCCWLTEFVFEFPLLGLLTDPAQVLADAYQRHVVGALGLEGLLLAWAFVVGLVLFVRGRVGKGLGEIALTLFIAAFAASAFVRPDFLLGEEGPLQQTHKAAIEVASITTASYFDTPARGGRPCDTAVGPAHEACVAEQADAKTVTDSIQGAITDALVVKPYMLLQYGRILDKEKENEKAAFKAHLQWVAGNANLPVAKEDSVACSLLSGPSKMHCEDRQKRKEDSYCTGFIGSAKDYCKDTQKRKENETDCSGLDPQTKERCRKAVAGEYGFPKLLKELKGAGSVGKSAAAYAEKPSWDRVWAVLALLIAVIVIVLMVISMAVVLLGAQGACAAAAAAGPIVWVLAMLPGPSRMLLRRWLGVFIVSALVAFMAAMALPLFGIAVDALLADSEPDQLMERLLLVDALALAFLVMHRRVLRAAAGFGAALAMRGRAAGSGSGGGGPQNPGKGHLAALSDGTGLPMNPGRLVGDAVAEGRRGIAPLALALNGAHSVLIGPRPAQHPAAARLHASAQGTASGRPAGDGSDSDKKILDKRTGETLYDPATDRPLLGLRIHSRASRLRAYRAVSRAAHFSYMATGGIVAGEDNPISDFTHDVGQQLRVVQNHMRPARRHTQPADRTGQVHGPAAVENPSSSTPSGPATVAGSPAGSPARSRIRRAYGGAEGAVRRQGPAPGRMAGPGSTAQLSIILARRRAAIERLRSDARRGEDGER